MTTTITDTKLIQPKCAVKVMEDGRVIARFWLQSDAELFAIALSTMKHDTPIVVDFDFRQSDRTYLNGQTKW